MQLVHPEPGGARVEADPDRRVLERRGAQGLVEDRVPGLVPEHGAGARVVEDVGDLGARGSGC